MLPSPSTRRCCTQPSNGRCAPQAIRWRGDADSPRGPGSRYVQQEKQKKLSILTEKVILAGYFCGEIDLTPNLKRSHSTCQITDNEARAVQRLILDMQGKSHVLDEWLDAVIDRYFYGSPISALVNESRTLMDVKFDIKCGLAAIHAKYPFIDFKSKASQ